VGDRHSDYFGHQKDGLGEFLLVFAGAAIGLASGTVARYAYPPPRRQHR